MGNTSWPCATGVMGGNTCDASFSQEGENKMNEERRKKKKGRMTRENGTTVVITSQLVTVGGHRSRRREEKVRGGKKTDGMTCGSGVVWDLFQEAQEGILDIIQKAEERRYWQSGILTGNHSSWLDVLD